MSYITELSNLNTQKNLVKGKVIPISPSPSLQHQNISMNLSGILYKFFKGKPDKVFAAPFNVRLYNHEQSEQHNQDIYTIVSPDLCVVCDSSKLDQQGCLGAPNLVIEIIAKNTAKKDIHTKYQLYQASGVKEYWLIYPHEQTIQQFILNTEDNEYDLHRMYSDNDSIIPYLFPYLSIELAEIFNN